MQPTPLHSLGPSLAHPPVPLGFPLSLNCSTLQETRSSCPQAQLKQLDPFQVRAGGKAPAPGDEVGRGSQAWEQPVSYGKGAIQGWETSLAPAWMRAQCISGPLPWRRQTLGGKSCEMWEEEPGWRLPGNFNSALDELPALCFCCRAQPANDKTSDPPQVHSVHLSICLSSLLLASCPDCPARTWVPCGSTPKASPKQATVPGTDLQGQDLTRGTGLALLHRYFSTRRDFCQQHKKKKWKLAKCPPGRGDPCWVRERRSTVTSWEPLPGFILAAFFKQNHA